MIRKIILTLVVLLMLTVGLTAGDTKGQKPDMKRTFDIPGDGPGYNLLRMMADEVVEMFKGFEHFNAVSDKWIIQARTAKDKGLVDGVFERPVGRGRLDARGLHQGLAKIRLIEK